MRTAFDLLRSTKDVASIDEIATYEIIGEGDDYNSISPPSLGFFHGKFRDVAEYAISLPNFVTWGSGGRIKKVKITNLTSKIVQTLIAEKRRIEQQEAEIAAKKRILQRELEALNKQYPSIR